MGLPSIVVRDPKTGWWYLWPLVPASVDAIKSTPTPSPAKPKR